jgi:hypothetical protein
MVKKLLPSGSACRKCLSVEAQMSRDGMRHRIHSVVYTGDGGRGDQLARAHNVGVAPFFVVRAKDGTEEVFTSYLRLRRTLTGRKITQPEAEEEVLTTL